MKNIIRISAQSHIALHEKIRRNVSLRVKLVSMSLPSRSIKTRRSRIVESSSSKQATTWNWEHKMHNSRAMVSWHNSITTIFILGSK